MVGIDLDLDLDPSSVLRTFKDDEGVVRACLYAITDEL